MGEDAEMPRREQGALLREVRLRQAEKQVKTPVPHPQPVHEEGDEMDRDVEEPEDEEEGEGTRDAPNEVVTDTASPREVPKPETENGRGDYGSIAEESCSSGSDGAVGRWSV